MKGIQKLLQSVSNWTRVEDKTLIVCIAEDLIVEYDLSTMKAMQILMDVKRRSSKDVEGSRNKTGKRSKDSSKQFELFSRKP